MFGINIKQELEEVKNLGMDMGRLAEQMRIAKEIIALCEKQAVSPELQVRFLEIINGK